MDTNLDHSPCNQVESNLLEINHLPDDHPNTCDNNPDSFSSNHPPDDPNYDIDKIDQMQAPLNDNDSQQISLNLRSNGDQLSSKQKKRTIKPNDQTQSILYDSFMPDGSFNIQFEGLEMPELSDGSRIVKINGIKHKILSFLNKEKRLLSCSCQFF